MTTKPPALCAHCPECGTHNVALRSGGTYVAHRRNVPTSRTMQVRTERCPGSLRAASPAALARWVAWETDNARNSAAYCARRLAEARAEFERAEAADAEARANLAAITHIAADLAKTTTDTPETQPR